MPHNNFFSHFGLNQKILTALSELGYENPTPVQEQGIPVLLQKEDLLAQAQTGTGKTAVFALPILSSLDHALKSPQALILTPTRELAIQVAEAFQSYAKYFNGFLAIPIYGGQDFKIQLRLLKRGAQVLVGTPGRLMDHLRRGSISLANIKTLVLDEADEMLKMGFVDDVAWILGHLTMPHQTALFSATLPPSIQKIAQKYLKNAKKIHIKSQTQTVDTISQSFITVSHAQKLDMLTRILEAYDTQGMIVFTRTKNSSAELAEKLKARGYAAAALNGDMSQSLREKTIDRLKSGSLDIVVATDVAARGLDVERITHVINYDIPHDVDSYIHRIGRTGRAGREGHAILFVTPREQRLFRDIENHIQKKIKCMEPPSLKSISEKRVSLLREKIVAVIRDQNKAVEKSVETVTDVCREIEVSPKEVAAALMVLHQQQLLSLESFDENPIPESFSREHKKEKSHHFRQDDRKKHPRKKSRDQSRHKRDDQKFFFKNKKQKKYGEGKKHDKLV